MVGVDLKREVTQWVDEGSSGGVRRGSPGRRSLEYRWLKSKMKVWETIIRSGRSVSVRVRELGLPCRCQQEFHFQRLVKHKHSPNPSTAR